MASALQLPTYTNNCCPQPTSVPLVPVAYPNENKSHVGVQPVIGTPGEDPCCKAVPDCPYPGLDETYSLCRPVACTAGAHDTTAPGSCYDSTSIHQRQCECPKCVAELHKFHEDGRVCYQHMDGNEYRGPTKSNSVHPEIQELRDRLSSSDGIKSALRWCPTDESLTCVVRRFRQANQGILGQAAIHYGAAQDPDYPRQLIHGVLSDEWTPAQDLINPPPKNWVDQLVTDVNESIYESNKVRPIGKSHEQRERLPPHVEPDETAFGKPSDKSISAGLLVNPPKTRFEVEKESKEFAPMYKFTHGDYDPGEQICRQYEGNFSRQNTFGKKTPHDIAGRWTRKIISTWRSCEPDPAYVSKLYADHLDFRYPKLGQPRDATCVRRDRGDGFVYGKPTTYTDEQRPVQEVIFNRCPNVGSEKAQLIMRNLKGWIDKVRKSCKEPFGPDLEKFYEEMISADEECQGTISWDPFIKAMQIQHIPRTLNEKDFMESLAYVGIFHPCPCDKIDYYKLMDYIKGYEEPMFGCKTTTLKPYYCPHTNGSVHFRTTYSDQCANMCVPRNCLDYIKEERVNGMPSVRYDRLPRKIRSTKDFTNYGDDGDAYSLIFPSVYTTQGITIRDAFKEMTKEQICRLFCLAEMPLSHEQIDRAWEAAQKLDPDNKCRVSYQTFREALCQVCDEMALERNQPPIYSLRPSDCPPQPCPKIKQKPNPCAGVDP